MGNGGPGLRSPVPRAYCLFWMGMNFIWGNLLLVLRIGDFGSLFSGGGGAGRGEMEVKWLLLKFDSSTLRQSDPSHIF